MRCFKHQTSQQDGETREDSEVGAARARASAHGPAVSASAGLQKPQDSPMLAVQGADMVYVSGLARNVVQGAYQLSPLDHTAMLTCLNPKAFWYRKALEPTMLRTSLSLVLKDYPCMAGRLAPHHKGRLCQWTPPSRHSVPKGVNPRAVASACRQQAFSIVICNAGAAFREVHASAWTMEDFPQQALGRCGFGAGPRVIEAPLPAWFEPVNILEMIQGRAPVLSVRLTRLGDGACILALTTSHAIVDGRSVCSFMQSWASVYRALTATGPLPTPYPVIPTSLSPISPIPHSPPASRARPDIDKHLATWLGAGSNRSQRGAPSASAGAAAAQQPRLPPCHNRDLLLYPPASESQLGSALNAGLAASAAPKSKVVQIHASAMASEPVAPPAPRAQAATPVRTPSATTPYTYGMVLGSIGQQRGPAASAEGSVRSGRTVPATAAASTDTHGEIQPAPPMQGSGMAARQGAAQQQQAGRVAHVTQPPGAAHPAALSSLQLQTAPADASLRGALKAGWKALQTVKEEMVVWPNLFTDLTTSFVHLPSETVAHVKALAADVGGTDAISTNDALTALVWTVVCDLRGRPLPGSAPAGSGHALGMAIDLRKNGLTGHLPDTLFANATWCIHIPSPSHPPHTPHRSPTLHTATTATPITLPVPVPVTAHTPPVSVNAARTLGGAHVAVSVPEPIAASADAVMFGEGEGSGGDESPTEQLARVRLEQGRPVIAGVGHGTEPHIVVMRPVTRMTQLAQLPGADGLTIAGVREPGAETAPQQPPQPQPQPESTAVKASAAGLSLEQAWRAAQSHKASSGPVMTGPRSENVLTTVMSLSPHTHGLVKGSNPAALFRAVSLGPQPAAGSHLLRTCSAAAVAAAAAGGLPRQPRFSQRQWRMQQPRRVLSGRLSGALGESTEDTHTQQGHMATSAANDNTLHGGVVHGASAHGEVPHGAGEQSVEVGEGDADQKQRWIAALRAGASAIRAALREVRQNDPAPRARTTTGGTSERAAELGTYAPCVSTTNAAEPGNVADGSTSELDPAAACAKQRGWEVLAHARLMSQAPLAAQLAMVANVFCGQDVMCTTWSFPYYEVDFGHGGPVRHQGLVHPSPPWAVAIQRAPPDLGGMLLQLNTPTSALSALRHSPVLDALAPGAKVL